MGYLAHSIDLIDGLYEHPPADLPAPLFDWGHPAGNFIWTNAKVQWDGVAGCSTARDGKCPGVCNSRGQYHCIQ